jgi:hypothetical protein
MELWTVTMKWVLYSISKGNYTNIMLVLMLFSKVLNPWKLIQLIIFFVMEAAHVGLIRCIYSKNNVILGDLSYDR